MRKDQEATLPREDPKPGSTEAVLGIISLIKFTGVLYLP